MSLTDEMQDEYGPEDGSYAKTVNRSKEVPVLHGYDEVAPVPPDIFDRLGNRPKVRIGKAYDLVTERRLAEVVHDLVKVDQATANEMDARTRELRDNLVRLGSVCNYMMEVLITKGIVEMPPEPAPEQAPDSCDASPIASPDGSGVTATAVCPCGTSPKDCTTDPCPVG